jgi:NAD(P)-dependent dehydrogenase (short-subunit alcohol dehydrogenase family)
VTRPALEGRGVVVAGASGDIGRAVVLACASAGASVLATGRDAGRLDTLAAQASDAGSPIRTLATDLSTGDAPAALARAAGPVTVLVSCVAAPLRRAAVLAGHDDVWREQMEVNFGVPRRLVEAFAPAMVSAGTGSIVVVSSVASRTSQPLIGAYSASKAALDSYVRTVALELGPHGVRANSVAPGLVDTTRTHDLAGRPEVGGLQRRTTPLGRLADAGDVAEVVVWLASDAARFVTGQAVTVDGGRSAGRFLAPAGPSDDVP